MSDKKPIYLILLDDMTAMYAYNLNSRHITLADFIHGFWVDEYHHLCFDKMSSRRYFIPSHRIHHIEILRET